MPTRDEMASHAAIQETGRALRTLANSEDGVLGYLERIAKSLEKLAMQGEIQGMREANRNKLIAAAANLDMDAVTRGPRDKAGNLETRCLPDACTGYIDDIGNIAHDGDTCPVHER